MTKKVIFWDQEFTPSYTPEEMLRMGVFEGKYINNIEEVPEGWKKIPKVLGKKDNPDPSLNYYGVKSRQPLSVWKKNGWIFDRDPEGWFSWYIKYFLGLRSKEMDRIQITRWKSFVARHQGQINNNCKLGDRDCRPRQRQGLLQWAWDSTKEFTEATREKNLKRILKITNTKSSAEIPSANW
jgi:hypothetical protein